MVIHGRVGYSGFITTERDAHESVEKSAAVAWTDSLRSICYFSPRRIKRAPLRLFEAWKREQVGLQRIIERRASCEKRHSHEDPYFGGDY